MMRRSDAISSSFNVVVRECNWLSRRSSSKAWVSANSGSISAMMYGVAMIGNTSTNLRNDTSAVCALSMSERCASCWSMTSRSASSPLRSSSSAASPAESATPAASTAIEIRMPNMPNRSSNCARVPASTGNGLSGRTNRSTLSRALLSSVLSAPASFCSAMNSVWRSVRAVNASSPDTGTTAWQLPV